MKIRQGFVSNSSSCSFLVLAHQTPRETDERIRKIIKFHNDLSGDCIVFTDLFYDSIIINGELASKYEKLLCDFDYATMARNQINELGGINGLTVIKPKVEDNEIPIIGLIEDYANAHYIRHDGMNMED